MLFNQKIFPSCAHCRFGSVIGGGEVACTKRGIMSEGGCCRQYIYDPLKRVPDRRMHFDSHKLAEIFPEDLNFDPEAEREAEREAQLEAEINARLNEELQTNIDADLLE